MRRDIDETMTSGAIASNAPANVMITGRGSVGDLRWGKKMLNNNKLVKRSPRKGSFSAWGRDHDPFSDSKKKKIKETALDRNDLIKNTFTSDVGFCYDNALVFTGADNRIYHIMDAGDGTLEIVRNSVLDDSYYEIANIPMIGSLIDSYNQAIRALANNEVEFQEDLS